MRFINNKQKELLDAVEGLSIQDKVIVKELGSLDAQSGIKMTGPAESYFGHSITFAGDVNKDGYDDIVVGAPYPFSHSQVGISYLVYGGKNITGGSGILDVSNMDSKQGMKIFGESIGDLSGMWLSKGGDINGDGYDDFLIAALNFSDNNKTQSGRVYALLGGSSIGDEYGNFNLSKEDGNRSFSFDGESAGDYLIVYPTKSSDWNQDGFDDILLMGGEKSYVIFGGTDLKALRSLNLIALDGSNGFQIVDSAMAGFTIWGGDLNGDGHPDIVGGTYLSSPGGRSHAGQAKIIFGNPEMGRTGTLYHSELNKTNSLIIEGESSGDNLGVGLAAVGDVNGDGIDDLALGAWQKIEGSGPGLVYLLFGGSHLEQEAFNLSSLNGTQGLKIVGEEKGDGVGISISGAGDVDEDGNQDILFGAPYSQSGTGKTYLIFGGPQIGSAGFLNLSDLMSGKENTRAVVFNGENKGDMSGAFVGGDGDINGDGINDTLIGVFSYSQKVYVDFNKFVLPSEIKPHSVLLSPIIISATIGFCFLSMFSRCILERTTKKYFSKRNSDLESQVTQAILSRLWLGFFGIITRRQYEKYQSAVVTLVEQLNQDKMESLDDRWRRADFDSRAAFKRHVGDVVENKLTGGHSQLYRFFKSCCRPEISPAEIKHQIPKITPLINLNILG